jgi:hypothetical protein
VTPKYESLRERPTAGPGRIVGALACVVLAGGVLGLALYCVAGWLHLRGYRPADAVFGVVLAVFLVLVTVASLVTQPARSAAVRGGLSLLAAVLASALAIMLILFVGIPFYLSIGGRM